MSAPLLGLTKRQADILAFIRAFVKTNGHAPNYTEMNAAVGGGRSNVHRAVACLVDRGYLVRLPTAARSLALADESVVPIPRDVLALIARHSSLPAEMIVRQAVRAYFGAEPAKLADRCPDEAKRVRG